LEKQLNLNQTNLSMDPVHRRQKMGSCKRLSGTVGALRQWEMQLVGYSFVFFASRLIFFPGLFKSIWYLFNICSVNIVLRMMNTNSAQGPGGQEHLFDQKYSGAHGRSMLSWRAPLKQIGSSPGMAAAMMTKYDQPGSVRVAVSNATKWISGGLNRVCLRPI